MIARDVCARVLQKAVSTGADYAEIFAENTVNSAISMIANRVENISNRCEKIRGCSYAVHNKGVTYT